MTDKIICPWCGAEMRASVAMLDVYGAIARYECSYCHACGPQRRGLQKEETSAAARAAAIRRYTPPLKPMTLEEAYEAEYCYLEHDTKGMDTQIVMLGMMSTNARNESRVEILEFGEDADYCGKLECSDYGKTWRCWSRKPTDEERSAAEWET